MPIKKEFAYAAHDMLRLGLSIVGKYYDLKKKYIEMSKENARLKRSIKSESPHQISSDQSGNC